MKSPFLRRLVLLTTVALAGCHQVPVAEPAEFSTPGWEEHRFLNHPRPYDKLLVEIDAVEGAGPSARELAELKLFLQEATDKPGGITIKVDNAIPQAVAARHSPNALALQYLNGPADDRTAFLYILFYRSKLAGLGVKPDQPYFTYFPYPCAVFIDRSYFGLMGLFYRAEMRRAFLLHEVSHALGLARHADHSKGGHCTNEACLMRSQIVFRGRRFFTLRQPWENTALCADCRRDLEAYKATEPKPHQRLWQGYFLHAGEGYQILTRPGFIYVHFGEVAELSEEDVEETRRAALTTPDLYIHVTATGFEPNQHGAALLRLMESGQNETIRELVQVLLEKCVSEAESFLTTEPDKAREGATDAMIAATKEFPELQARFESLRRKLGEPAGPLQ